MKRTLMQATIVVAIAVGGLGAAGPAAAQPAPEKNFGSHVSHCARMGGFSSDHNPSKMFEHQHENENEHTC